MHREDSPEAAAPTDRDPSPAVAEEPEPAQPPEALDREGETVVVVRYRISPEEEHRGMETHFRRAKPMARRILMAAAMCAIAAIPIYFHRSFPSTPILWLLAAIPASWLSLPLLRTMSLKAATSGLPEGEKGMELRLSPSYCRSTTPNFDVIQRWAAFPKGLQSRDGLLLYINSDLVRWIPRGIFADDGEFGRVAGWARAGIPEFVALDPGWRDPPAPADPGPENPYRAPEEVEPPWPDASLASALRDREDGRVVAIRHRVTPEEQRRSLKARFRHEEPPKKRLRDIADAGMFAAIPIYFYQYFPSNPLLWLLAAIAANSLAQPLLRRRRLRKQFAALREWEKEIEWRLSPSCAHGTNANADVIIRWGAFRKGLVSDDGLLLFLDFERTHWLPRHSFANDDEYKQAVNWARLGILEFVELDPGWGFAPAPRLDRARAEPAPPAGGQSPNRSPG